MNRKLATIEKHALEGMKQLADYPMSDPEALVYVNSALRWVKTQSKDLRAQLKEITEPQRKAEKAARDLFRPALEMLEQLERICKRKIGDYELARIHERQQAMQALVASPADVQLSLMNTICESTELTGTSVRTVWSAEIVDANQVPAEYCSPDARKINAAVAAGVRDIPGVLISQKTQVSTRTL